MSAEIRIAAAAILDRQGRRMLMVRKRGTAFFMQPGGKIDAGETPIEALIRELREELALELAPDLLRHRGIFSDHAANEDGMIVTADLFTAFADPQITPQAEIEEALWHPVGQAPTFPCAPLSLNHVLPLVRRLTHEVSA
ncbi:NUDIX domain-containing protein [Paracoccus caeni]|uniref:NUDIX domain-containing protein n=1 Tax=Paracoccus caeni TaxID=657651 RepID=A0A934SJK9_9RHOB|nr:NUDIX domain-containing protein [Paracoccus caeni]MBK4215623.1 NUDIX domain-containing protein [Paracoccus caeni]